MIKIYVDGGKNHIAYVIEGQEERLIYMPTMASGNQREYQAFIAGLVHAYAGNYRNVAFYSDSELMVNQVNGIYETRSPDLISLKIIAESYIRHFDSLTLQYIPREQNLAGLLLDKKAKTGGGGGGTGRNLAARPTDK